MAWDAVGSIQKQLNGLGDYERIQNGAFFDAMRQVVDDPNLVVDADDSDSDGNTTELVPAFQVWWDNRVKQLRAQAQAAAASKPSVPAFLQGTLRPLKDAVKLMITELHRGDIECQCAGSQGRMVELAQALENGGYPLSFWEPGPDKAAWLNWYTCKDCSGATPAGFDALDRVHQQYDDFLQFACGLLDPNGEDATCWDLGATPAPPSSSPLTPDSDEPTVDVGAAWRYWLPLLYDPNSDADYYDTLNVMTNAEGGIPDPVVVPDDDGNPVVEQGTCGDSVTPNGFAGTCAWGNAIKGTLRLGLPRCKLAYGSYTASTTDLVDPITASCSSDPQLLYTCPWQTSSAAVTGTYFSNPLCRIYRNGGGGLSGQAGDDLFQLTTQITTVRNFVFGSGSAPSSYALTTYLRDKHFAGDPCQATMNIQVQSLGVSGDALQYGFDYDCPTDPAKKGSINDEAKNLGAPSLTIPKITADVWGTMDTILTDFQDTIDDAAGPATNGKFATIDQDPAEEPRTVFGKMQEYRIEINKRLVELRNFAQAMDLGAASTAPLAYAWQDNRGAHTVTVATGPFKVAKLGRKKTGNFLVGQTCQFIENYADNGNNAWVEITTVTQKTADTPADPALWTWNLGGTVRKRCKVSYSYNRVQIAGR